MADVLKEGSTVGLEYTLRLDDGSVVDRSEAGSPLVYRQGAGQILPALEQRLDGLAVGDEKRVELPPEEGYGPVREELFQTVPAAQVPEGAREPGTPLKAVDDQGRERHLRVHEVRRDDDAIVLDFNHPLAGRNLFFQVKVISIE